MATANSKQTWSYEGGRYHCYKCGKSWDWVNKTTPRLQAFNMVCPGCSKEKKAPAELKTS